MANSNKAVVFKGKNLKGHYNMKKFISTFLLIINSLLCNSIFYQLNKASALQDPINSEYIESDIVYRLNEEDKTASVVEAKNLEAKEIIIPEEVNGY